MERCFFSAEGTEAGTREPLAGLHEERLGPEAALAPVWAPSAAPYDGGPGSDPGIPVQEAWVNVAVQAGVFPTVAPETLVG